MTLTTNLQGPETWTLLDPPSWRVLWLRNFGKENWYPKITGWVTAESDKRFILIKSKVVFPTKKTVAGWLCREVTCLVTWGSWRKLHDAVGRGKQDVVLSTRSKDEMSHRTVPQTDRKSGWTCFPLGRWSQNEWNGWLDHHYPTTATHWFSVLLWSMLLWVQTRTLRPSNNSIPSSHGPSNKTIKINHYCLLNEIQL